MPETKNRMNITVNNEYLANKPIAGIGIKPQRRLMNISSDKFFANPMGVENLPMNLNAGKANRKIFSSGSHGIRPFHRF